MPRHLPITLLLLWAAVLRFIGLANGSPPGLSHDEVANWLIDRAILAGEHAVYFTAAYGHEAGFHYWQALLIALIGDHVLALRLAAAYLGVGTVAVTYTLCRRLFNHPVAFLAAGITATHFWPVFFSRQALRAMLLPFTAGLAIYFLHRYLFDSPNGPRNPNRSEVWRLSSDVSRLSSLVSGRQGLASQAPTKTSLSLSLSLSLFFASFSTYTYMASRALPFLLVGWVGYLTLLHRHAIRLSEKWRGLLLFFVVYALLALPLVATIRAAPEAEARIAEVDGPLRALLAGDAGPVLENGAAILRMFGFEGDPLWRHNIAGRPVFGWPLAILFYAGVAIGVWRWRDPRYGLLLIWAGVAALPSLLTIDAPSTIRMILFLPILGLFPAIVIHNLSTLSTVFPQLSTVFSKNLGITVLTFAILLFSSGRTVRDIGLTWPANDEVQFVWQRDLTTAAAWLDAHPVIEDATVVGWTPETMDEPTLAVTLRRDDIDLRFTGRVGAVTTAVVPSGDPAAAVILRPAILPFESALEEALGRHGVQAAEVDGVAVYRWAEPFAPRPAVELEAVFSDELTFWGYDEIGSCRSTTETVCHIVTYWRVETQTADKRRFFLHIIDAGGAVVAQSDVLDAPARFWRPGDWLVQVHTLPATAADVSYQLGIYDPRPPFTRLSAADGRTHLEIKTAEN